MKEGLQAARNFVSERNRQGSEQQQGQRGQTLQTRLEMENEKSVRKAGLPSEREQEQQCGNRQQKVNLQTHEGARVKTRDRIVQQLELILQDFMQQEGHTSQQKFSQQ